MSRRLVDIFRRGSRTYFYSSLFFPKQVRDDVLRLYAFVRVADDFVDRVPPQVEKFGEFCDKLAWAWAGNRSGDEVIDEFVAMAKRRGFDKEWVEAFLAAMRSDLRLNIEYKTERELLNYMYGSAEVVGLMMARIMGLPKQAEESARLLGRAMQYVNFIRDVAEDKQLGRKYLPGLPDRGDPSHDAFIRKEIEKYLQWDDMARKGFAFIPRRYLVAIKTADKMYRWTANVIYNRPQVIYERKVKPSAARIVWTGVFSSWF